MMLSLITDALSDRADVTLVASDPSDQIPASQIDVVLTPAPDPEDLTGPMELLWRWPRSRVVVVAGSGRVAVVYELQPQKTVLGDLSPATLVNAICH